MALAVNNPNLIAQGNSGFPLSGLAARQEELNKALFEAASGIANDTIIQELLLLGARLTYQPNFEGRPVHTLNKLIHSSKVSIATFELALKTVNPKEDIFLDHNGREPIEYALINDQPHKLMALLKAGFDPNFELLNFREYKIHELCSSTVQDGLKHYGAVSEFPLNITSQFTLPNFSNTSELPTWIHNIDRKGLKGFAEDLAAKFLELKKRFNATLSELKIFIEFL